MEEFETVTSPEDPKTRDAGRVTNLKDFSGGLTLDLTDDEISQATKIIITTKEKWSRIFRSRSYDSMDRAMQDLSDFEDEIKTRLAESLNLLATVDVMPVLDGKPPEVVLMGALPGHSVNQYGLDHEKKAYEVNLANTRGEVFLGAKEEAPGTAKRRDENRYRPSPKPQPS